MLVLSGKDKGKRGAVVRVFPGENKVVVEGVNVVTRHVRQRQGARRAWYNRNRLYPLAK